MKPRPSVEVVRYRDPSKRKKQRENVKKGNGLLHQTLDDNNDTKFMKTKDLLARLEFDVNTFALSGFSKEEKRKRERDRALKLGAVPRKKKRSEKPMNYKEFLLQQKSKPAEEEAHGPVGINNKTPSSSKTSKKNDDRPKKTVFWQEPTKSKGKFGTLGTYKNGVLKLSKEDLKSIKFGKR